MVSNLAAMMLGCVFALAGAAKLVQGPHEVRDGMAPLLSHFPATLKNLVAWVLAPTELLLGLALVVGFGRVAAATCAIVLLVGFTVVLVRVVRQGRPVQCRCFGSLSAESVGGWSIARNLVLLALAAATLTTDSTTGTDVDSTLVTVMLLASGVVAAGLARHGAVLLKTVRKWEEANCL